jgi:gamma-glutamylcyclotransferase (GGCT)/AIG2-like uncharacterized protein YtfP
VTDHLFVYGTLLSGLRHEMGLRLAREARCLGVATVPGRLFRVSWYPAIVASASPSDRVHGEVFGLTTPAGTLAWLDAYEGIAGSPDDEYERVRVDATLDRGASAPIPCWVYRFRQDVTSLQPIPSGRWTG